VVVLAHSSKWSSSVSAQAEKYFRQRYCMVALSSTADPSMHLPSELQSTNQDISVINLTCLRPAISLAMDSFS